MAQVAIQPTQLAVQIRAFVNFKGSDGSIRRQFNVSSITRNGAGDYTVNFTTALPVDDGGSGSYAAIFCTAQRDSDNIAVGTIHGSATYNQISSTAVTVQVRDDTNNLVEGLTICVMVVY